MQRDGCVSGWSSSYACEGKTVGGIYSVLNNGGLLPRKARARARTLLEVDLIGDPGCGEDRGGEWNSGIANVPKYWARGEERWYLLSLPEPFYSGRNGEALSLSEVLRSCLVPRPGSGGKPERRCMVMYARLLNVEALRLGLSSALYPVSDWGSLRAPSTRMSRTRTEGIEGRLSRLTLASLTPSVSRDLKVYVRDREARSLNYRRMALRRLTDL
jgi:hypothetical protein